MTKEQAAAILGIENNASTEEALREYARQARLVDPRRFENASDEDKEAANISFNRLNTAIEVFLSSEGSEKNKENTTSESQYIQETTSSTNYIDDQLNENINPKWPPPKTEHWSETTNSYQYFDESGTIEVEDKDWGFLSEKTQENITTVNPLVYENTTQVKKTGMVGPIEAVKSFIVNTFAINYSSTRAEYWWVVLTTIPISFLIGVFDFILWPDELLFTFSNAFALVLVIPSITLGIRRLHDVNVSGWWLLFLGPVPLLAFLAFEPVYAIWPVLIGWFALFIFSISGSKTSRWKSLLR